MTEEDEARIGRAQAELAVLKKDARAYETRRIAGQALEVITLLRASRPSWVEPKSAHVIMVPWCQCCEKRVNVDHICACESQL